jgi:two-component system sensor histidine kinase SenX3
MEVRDSGAGIVADEQGRIFERVYRIDKARSRALGLRLGLAIARWIVSQHNGSITVGSNACNGSIFRMRLARIPTRPNPRNNLGAGRVDIREILAYILPIGYITIW